MEFEWKKIFEIFKKPTVSKEKVEFPKADFSRVREILVEEHDFSLERVEKQLDKLTATVASVSITLGNLLPYSLRMSL